MIHSITIGATIIVGAILSFALIILVFAIAIDHPRSTALVLGWVIGFLGASYLIGEYLVPWIQ